MKSKRKNTSNNNKRPFPAGGTPSFCSTPIKLEYEPFADSKNMKRLLGDLAKWTLERKIHHRLASTCKGLIKSFLEVDEYEKLPDLEKRVKALEARVNRD